MVMNNLNIDFIRRLAIGAGFSLIFIFLIQALTHNGGPAIDTRLLDQETIAMPEPVVDEDDIPDDVETVKEDSKNIALYDFFAKHKRSTPAISPQDILLSIIINDVGQSRKIVEMVSENLPKNVTIGLSSHTRNHDQVAKALQDHGHEVWLKLSTLTSDLNTNRGPNALDPTNNLEWNLNALSKQTDQKDFITGLIFSPDTLIRRSNRLWERLVNDIFANGYGLLDHNSRTAKSDLFFYDGNPAPYINGDVFIADHLNIQDIESILDDAARKLRDGNDMIISVQTKTPVVIDIMKQWLDSIANEQNIRLVPLSAQAKL